MKVKNIAFSGFMASILMAGAAYAEGVPTLATDQYVIQGVNYAISQAGTLANAAQSAAEATAASDATSKANAAQAAAEATAAGALKTHTDNTTVHITAEERTAWSAKQDALPATSGKSGKVLKVNAQGGLEWADDTDTNTTYDDTALKGRVKTLEDAGYITKDVNNLTNYTTTSVMESNIATAVAAKDQLSKLTDVAITSAANGQVLQYNSTDSKWENAALGALATKSAVTESDISGDISSGKISGLGSLATKSAVTESDISGNISSGKISGLGSLATKSTVTSTDITDGTITNADISGTAAIAQSKIAGLTDALGALTCEAGKYCLIVGNTATPYDLAITNTRWTTTTE